LADGGRVGFYRGGGTKNKTTVLSQPKTLMPWDLGATQSGNKGAFGYLQGVSGPMWTGADIMNFIQDNPKWGGTNFSGILQGKWNSDTNRYEPPAVAHKYAMEQINDPELLKVMRNMMDPDLPLMDPNKTPEENTTVDTEEIWDDYDAGNEAKGIEVNKGEQTVDNNTGKVIDPEESTAISADDVREQAALFDKLLNEDYKKDLKSARISDASDYALKFFEETIGKGKGMKEAAGEVAGFALAKPSKTETVKEGKKKTKQTATVMAINEALASNKSDRELDKMFAKMGLDEQMRKRLLLERVNLETAVARGLSIRQRINADKSSGTSDMNKLRNHTKGFAEDFEKNNDLPTGSVAVTSILTEKKEGSQLPIVADIKSLVVEENKNQIFIDESSKKVYQVVEDANGNLTLKTLAQ
jgi:hypothetical protein